MQRVLVERAARQRVLRGGRDLVQRLGRGEAVLGGEPLDLPAQLGGELAVVAGDQRAAVEREVVGRERVDRSAHDVGDDELAGIDRPDVRRRA